MMMLRERHLTEQDLAEMFGVSRKTIVGFLSGFQGCMRIPVYFRICAILGLHPQDYVSSGN